MFGRALHKSVSNITSYSYISRYIKEISGSSTLPSSQVFPSLPKSSQVFSSLPILSDLLSAVSAPMLRTRPSRPGPARPAPRGSSSTLQRVVLPAGREPLEPLEPREPQAVLGRLQWIRVRRIVALCHFTSLNHI